MRTQIGQNCFSLTNQKNFADAVGDWNPIHMDPLVARRTPQGAPIVHGLHNVLACLDCFAQTSEKPTSVSKISVNFPKPVYVGDPAEYFITRQTNSATRLVVETHSVTAATIDLSHDTATKIAPLNFPSDKTRRSASPSNPIKQDLTQIVGNIGKKGRMEIYPAVAQLFPHAAHWLGSARVAALAALSSIVGMQCPGLHSIFVGFSVDFTDDGAKDCVEFSLLDVDDRFRRISLGFGGGGLKGTIQALVRMPPIPQPNIADLAKEIKPGSFSNQHALIVGGSRGLGEYTAKAIVAGGGTVTLTYAVGRAEAEAVLSDIKSAGGKGDLLAYDIRQPAAPQLKTLQSPPTHVYYFATNSIFRHRGNDFDTAKFMEFYEFYVGGFYDLCKALRATVPSFKVFYPSSIFVTTRQRGVTEYAMAKAAGEIMCADLPRLLPGVTVHMSRLPRLPTDQTATAMQTGMENTADIILPILRAMQE